MQLLRDIIIDGVYKKLVYHSRAEYPLALLHCFLFIRKQVSFEVQTLAFRVCGMKNDTHG